MTGISDNDFSTYVDAFNQELQSSQSPESEITDKVSACAILALSNRGDPYARQHPELKNKAITVLQEEGRKEAPLIVDDENLSELAEKGDLPSLLKKEELIKNLSPEQKLQLLRAARLQSTEVFRTLAELVSVIDVFEGLSSITILEHEDLIAKLSLDDKIALLKSSFKLIVVNAVASAVTEEDINQSKDLVIVLSQRAQALPRHLRAAVASKDANLISNIKNYGFDRKNSEDKEILASLRSKLPIKCGELGFCIQNLDLDPQNAEDKKVLIDLAKQLAKNDPEGIGEVIQNFGLDPIVDREALLEIINLSRGV